MGFFKDLVGIAAPIAGGIFGGPVGSAIGGAIGGAVSGSGQPKSQTSTVQQQMDPRFSNILFGNGPDNKGILSQYQNMLGAPRSDAALGFANANGSYLGNAGADMGASRDAAYRAMQGNQAPMMQAAQSAGVAPTQGAQAGGALASLPAYATGNMVNAPSQNGLNLSGSYDSLINGQAGNNPYLTGAIQKGINQSSNAFGNMLTDAKSATQDLLGNVRGGAIASGQYGSSRQGLAEGKAIDSFNTNTSRAAAQFGQNNTDAAVAAQAGAYDADRSRQLAATQGLGAQQYGVASQDAATKNQAEFMNVGNAFDASKTNAAMAQQNGQFNAGLAQQTGQFNANLGQNNAQFNAGLQQQGGLANQQSQLSTNAQNSSNNLAGAGLLSGLLGNASGQVNYNDGYALNQAQGVNSLLAPYLGGQRSGTSSQTDPLYSSTMGNAIGGAGLGSQLGSLFGGGTSTSSSAGSLTDLFGIGKSGGGLFGSGSYF